MVKVIPEMPLLGRSAFEIAYELNLPHDFLSEVLHEHSPKTYGELIEILEIFYRDEIVKIVKLRAKNDNRKRNDRRTI